MSRVSNNESSCCMDLEDRATAIRALASCDQMESFIADEDEEAIETMRGMVRSWVAKLSTNDLRVIIKCIRARASEVLAVGTYD